MPTGLRRCQTQGHDHFITFSCYRRLPYLDDNNAKSTFEHIFEETRANYGFETHAHVVLPENVTCSSVNLTPLRNNKTGHPALRKA